MKVLAALCWSLCGALALDCSKEKAASSSTSGAASEHKDEPEHEDDLQPSVQSHVFISKSGA